MSRLSFRPARLGSIAAFVLVSAATLVVIAQQPRRDGVDDVQGTRWHYEITKPKQSKAESGDFRVYKKVIYRNNKQVGVVHAESNTETKLEINGLPELNGKATLRKVDERPPVWRGQLIRKDGEHWKMKVEMKDK